MVRSFGCLFSNRNGLIVLLPFPNRNGLIVWPPFPNRLVRNGLLAAFSNSNGPFAGLVYVMVRMLPFPNRNGPVRVFSDCNGPFVGLPLTVIVLSFGFL